MPSDSRAVWIEDVRKILAESHPCDARRLAEETITLLAKTLSTNETLNREIQALRREVLRAKLGAKKEEEVGEQKSKTSGSIRSPKVWRNGVDSRDWPSEDGVKKVEDRDGDLYLQVDPGQWDRCTSEACTETTGSPKTMKWLVNSYGPIIEKGDDVRVIRWFEDDEDFDSPDWGPSSNVYFLEDAVGEVWAMVNSVDRLYGLASEDADTIKEIGWWTARQIAENSGFIMAVGTGTPPDSLVWGPRESEPHKTIKWVSNPKTSWFYARGDDGLWAAPGVGDGMKIRHSDLRITWDELLKHAETLKEYRR